MPAASEEMCRKLTSSLGSYQGCITPTRPPPTPLSLSQRLCFIPSHIRASHNLTTTTDTTTRTSHPRSSYPLLIFTLNLVLLSGLRLNIPSEISYFKKTHEQSEQPMLYDCSHHRLPQPDVSKGSGIQNKIRFPDPVTN